MQRKVRALPRTAGRGGGSSRRKESVASSADESAGYSESDDPSATHSPRAGGRRPSPATATGAGAKEEAAPPAASEFKAPKPPRSPVRSPVNELRKHFTKGGFKRGATSPVYLDGDKPNVASIPSSARRVAQCVSTRLRGAGASSSTTPAGGYAASLEDEGSSPDSPRRSTSSADSPPVPQRPVQERKGRRGSQAGVRNKWTLEETHALVHGCNEHGIGQWKAIRDSEPLLAKRTPGDLKDRFRTYYPDAYRKHYPNAKTHMSERQRSKDKDGNELFGENAARRERKQFSAAEDEALRRGYVKYGTAWSTIARDPILLNRKSTDLRDRFRNAFPDLYGGPGSSKQRSRRAHQTGMFSFMSDTMSPGMGTFSANPTAGAAFVDPNAASLYPTYPSRAMEFNMRAQLPPLDFLKSHPAEAFGLPQGYVPDTTHAAGPSGEGADSVVDLKASLTRSMTPRAGVMITPRPSETTPRPRGFFGFLPHWMAPGFPSPHHGLPGVPEMSPLIGFGGGVGAEGGISPAAIDPALHVDSSTATIVPPPSTLRPPFGNIRPHSSVDLAHLSHLNLAEFTSHPSAMTSPAVHPGGQHWAGAADASAMYSLQPEFLGGGGDGGYSSSSDSAWHSGGGGAGGGGSESSPETDPQNGIAFGIKDSVIYGRPGMNHSSPELVGPNHDEGPSSTGAGMFTHQGLSGAGIFETLGAGAPSFVGLEGTGGFDPTVGGFGTGTLADGSTTATVGGGGAAGGQDGFNFHGMMGALEAPSPSPLSPIGPYSLSSGIGRFGAGGLGSIPEAMSSASSFRSSLENPSVESFGSTGEDASGQSDHDQVLYTAADQPVLFGMSANGLVPGGGGGGGEGGMGGGDLVESPFSPVARSDSSLSNASSAHRGRSGPRLDPGLFINASSPTADDQAFESMFDDKDPE